MAKIIGIDLGTSNSAAAVMQGNRPVIIPSAEGISLGGKAFPLVPPAYRNKCKLEILYRFLLINGEDISSQDCLQI